MRIRVEELAIQADVSVDTVRFYQKQGLVPPPERDGRLAWYGRHHLERIARVKDLQKRGFSLAVIRRFLAGELDPADESLAAAVVQAGGGDRAEDELFDLAELSARTSVAPPLLESLVREGLLIPRPTAAGPRFTTADASTVAAGVRLVEAGLPMPELFELARRHHAVTREIATDAVELFDTYIRRPLRDSSMPEAEKGDRLAEAFATLMPAVTSLVANHFRRVLIQVAQERLEAVGAAASLEAAGADAGTGLHATVPQTVAETG